MTAPAAALALKVEGQALAGRRATSAHRAAFVAAVRAIPVGSLFTVNDLRARLGETVAARASLMAAAARDGLHGHAEHRGSTRRERGRHRRSFAVRRHPARRRRRHRGEGRVHVQRKHHERRRGVQRRQLRDRRERRHPRAERRERRHGGPFLRRRRRLAELSERRARLQEVRTRSALLLGRRRDGS